MAVVLSNTASVNSDALAVEDRCVCIATAAGFPLAAMISSYFNSPGKYFAVFEFPTLDFPYTGASDEKSDGYFAHILGDKAAGEINNALARIQPKHILLVGVTEIEQTYLRSRLPEKRLVEVADISHFLSKFNDLVDESEILTCKTSQVTEGLLAARFSNRRLRIDDNAPDLPREIINGGTGLLVLEAEQDVHDIAAVNYAAAFNLDVVLIPPVARETVRAAPEMLAKWSNDHSYHEYKLLERRALQHLRQVDFQRYEFATFFTQGIPYGLLLKNVIPFTHVLRQIDPGIFIANNLRDDDNPRAFGSSLHFSPHFFPSEETDEVIKLFAENNFVTKALVDDDATARNLSDFASYYPYDVLHICSHGGETGGYFVVQTFTDRAGQEHKVEYYEVIQIDPVDGKVAQLTQKMIYHRFDGHKWGSPLLREIPQYVFIDMNAAMRENEAGVIRVPVNYPIAFSCHIRCHDGLHQGAFQTLADLGRPLVFNNTCSSSHELAPILVSAGARAYLGTLWEVGNTTAVQAAKTFYSKAMKDQNLLAAFHEMVKLPTRSKDANVYILWGLHFSTLRKPAQRSDDAILGALLQSFLMWLHKVTTTGDPAIARNGIPIVAFLYKQLVLTFGPERLAELENIDREAMRKMMESLPSDDEENATRGYDNILISETSQDEQSARFNNSESGGTISIEQSHED
jgi:hypothetical protein